MPIVPGTRLGPYEINASLGAGGMGEVYRARDSRLGRDVAIKVLPQHLSSAPEVRARFEREAKTISSLNHPHICTLHDIGREGETDYLVMELVEGDTLAARLEKGPVPAEEALRVGIQIADALERAHRAGIVHRDLKPGNIMLAKSGAKLMDFGLARAAGVAVAAGSLTQSPTMTRALTSEGAIVGTFQYMAPEQLEGVEADARSDIWALGAVLYEMATGQKAFAGHSQASLIASILKEEPRPVSQLQPLAPPALDQLIRACLAKDPDQRIQTAHDVKLQLQWIAEGGSQAGIPAPVAARRRRRESLAWVVAAVGLLAALGLGAFIAARRSPAPRVLRFEVGTPSGAAAIGWPRLSPDGQMLAFLGSDSGGTQRIWVRPLDVLEARALPGTEGAGRPFWSPDSRFLAYIADGKLRKVPVAGGPPVTVADTQGGFDGSWGSRNLILFDGSATDSIRGVSASGGSVRPFTRFDRAGGEAQHGWPYFLPDGRHFLYVTYPGSAIQGIITIGTVGSNKIIKLGETDGRVEYAPPGYLVFTREGTLMAQPFDARALKTTGDPVPVGENITMGNASGFFSVSPAGLLAYRSERSREQSQLVWFDRSGKRLGDAGPPAEYRDIALSPDGARIAMCMVDAQKGREDVWVRQISRGVTSRLTFDDGTELNPVWSPDGERVAYSSDRSGGFRTYIRLASGVGGVDSVASVSAAISGPTDWAPDGGTMAVRVTGGGGYDIWMVPTAPGSKAAVFLATPFNENWARFSPDGRWIAYQSNESGRNEIYVQAASGAGGKWQVSTAGGSQPWWRSDGREIIYRAPDQSITAVPVTAGERFEAGTPLPLFKAQIVESGFSGTRWLPSADGKRFLVNMPLRGPEPVRFTVATNWTTELKRR